MNEEQKFQMPISKDFGFGNQQQYGNQYIDTNIIDGETHDDETH